MYACSTGPLSFLAGHAQPCDVSPACWQPGSLSQRARSQGAAQVGLLRVRAAAAHGAADVCHATATARAHAHERQVRAPASVVLRPGAASAVELAYRPLLAGEAAAVLAVAAPGLGPLRFRLRLAAGPAPALRTLSFSAALGSAETQARPCARLLCTAERGRRLQGPAGDHLALFAGTGHA